MRGGGNMPLEDRGDHPLAGGARGFRVGEDGGQAALIASPPVLAGTGWAG